MAATYSSLIGVAVGGKYEIRRVLGAGGMGVVCEAVHLDLGKRVAVKLIDRTMQESELIVARFRREARAAGQINSEHIVDVFDVGADARVGLYMVMEYLVGEDLQTRLERDKRLDVRTGVMIAHQIARGLAKAHDAGVIHRDLKPANVYITQRDNGQLLVKLLDFGVSKLLDDAPGSARITGTGAPIGTPLYMSPEQAEGKDDVDGRADIWSLGAVLYETLSGTPPFPDRGSYHGTIVGILTSRPKLLHDAAPWVPPEIADIVDAMLVHDRDARLPGAMTVTQRLLDSFPSVLPDGTGKHTAVIVPEAARAVDAIGDTEVFTSPSAPSVRASRPSTSPGSRPRDSQRPKESGPRESGSRDTGRRSDAPEARPSPDASLTGTATPIAMGHPRSMDFEKTVRTTAPPTSGSSAPGAGGPKTAPLPPSSRPSGPDPTGANHSGNVAMLTPSRIDPLPGEMTRMPKSGGEPPVRTGRRRALTLASMTLAIVGVAVGGFLAGRHVTPNPPAPPAPFASVPVNAAASAPKPASSGSSATAPSTNTSAGAPSASTTGPAPSTSMPSVVEAAAASARPAIPAKKMRPRPVAKPEPPPPVASDALPPTTRD